MTCDCLACGDHGLRHGYEIGEVRRRPSLSERELLVLRGIADGLTDKEIAARLRPPTTRPMVHEYGLRIRQRLGALNRTHAVAIAMRAGLIS